MKKIELQTEVPQEQVIHKKRNKKIFRIILVPFGIFAIFFFLAMLFLIPFRGIIVKAQDFANVGKSALTAVKSQDIEQSKQKLKELRVSLDSLNAEYKKVIPFKFVPILGSYIADGEHGVKAMYAAISAGDKAIEALEPNADLLGLKGKSTFVSGTAEDRLQTAVKTMSALTPKINEIANDIDTLRKELDYIDPNRYPVSIRGVKVRSGMVSAKTVIEDAANLFVNAQPLLVNLPKLLGAEKEQRYLVLFQNDKELRPTGGFITAYAQFRMAKGKLILEKADDIYTLDASLKKKFPAPREISTFHKGVYQWNLRDSNLSPDFKLSMQQFETMYQATNEEKNIDGIIAVDTHVLVETLKILGPITVYGRTFSADLDKRCDCPKAVYELEDYSTRPVNYVKTARKDIIGVLLHEILRMALGVSPSKYWGNLFKMLLTEINEKHVLTYFHDDSAQKAAESFNLAGRIMTASESAALLKYKEGGEWDYLHINNSNMAGAKSNMFVSDKVTKDTAVNSDGTVTTKLTIEYKNLYPGSDCGLESGGLCLNAPLRNWIRIYVPIGSKLTESKGSISPKDEKPIPLSSMESLNKTVFEGFLIVNPLGTAKLELTYTSPVKPTGGYKLLIQKQPGTDGEQYVIKMNSKEKKSFPLQTDTELTL